MSEHGTSRPSPAPGVLPDPLPVRPLGVIALPRECVLMPPGSKSLTNRALLLAALAEGTSTLHGALRGADDTERMLAALASLGVGIAAERDGSLRITGVAGRFDPPADALNLNNAGTATRFLAAAALLADGPVVIDGNERMRQRPIGELIEALRHMGADVEELGSPGCPPLRITAPESLESLEHEVGFGRTQSSQFLSALLLIGPWLPFGLTMRLTAAPTSPTYLEMTLGLLEDLGALVRRSVDNRVLRVASEDGRGLTAFDLDIEPDASGATYFWAAAALFPRVRVAIAGLDETSLQGDARFPELLARMGAGVESVPTTPPAIRVTGGDSIRPILADMEGMPDAAVTLAVVCAFASGPSVIRGVRTLRVKETDRIAALQTELAKVGVVLDADVNDDPDTMTITPPAGGIDCSPQAPRVEFDTYRDHRMAMALALVGLRRPNVFIRDPGCVDKTYPDYWADLARFRAAAEGRSDELG